MPPPATTATNTLASDEQATDDQALVGALVNIQFWPHVGLTAVNSPQRVAIGSSKVLTDFIAVYSQFTTLENFVKPIPLIACPLLPSVRFGLLNDRRPFPRWERRPHRLPSHDRWGRRLSLKSASYLRHVFVATTRWFTFVSTTRRIHHVTRSSTRSLSRLFARQPPAIPSRREQKRSDASCECA